MDVMHEIKMNQEDIGLILISIEGHINTLRNRFKEEEEYIHPALKYEALLSRLEQWHEPINSDNYELKSIS